MNKVEVPVEGSHSLGLEIDNTWVEIEQVLKDTTGTTYDTKKLMTLTRDDALKLANTIIKQIGGERND